MNEWQNELFEYRSLLGDRKLSAKYVAAGIDLHPRVQELSEKLGARAPWSRKRVMHPLDLEVTYTVGGRFAKGTLRDVTGGGMIITSDDIALGGTRTMVRLRDKETNQVYLYPAKVKWSVSEKGFGILFDGHPQKDDGIDFASIPSFTFGVKQKRPNAA